MPDPSGPVLRVLYESEHRTVWRFRRDCRPLAAKRGEFLDRFEGRRSADNGRPVWLVWRLGEGPGHEVDPRMARWLAQDALREHVVQEDLRLQRAARA